MATKFGIGQPMRRSEDPRLLKGGGRYTDDVSAPGQAQAYFLRSPFAHAEIRSIDIAAAAAMSGVIGIVTIADLDADGIGELKCYAPVKNSDGSDQVLPPRPILARGRVRHVGEPVALVVAETIEQAKDAAEAIEVDYESLPAAVDPAKTLNGPAIWDKAPNNLCFDWEFGQKDKVSSLFAQADKVVRLDLVNNRVVASPMEPRCCNADWDATDGRFVLYVSCQGVHLLRDMLANDIFKLPPEKFLVRSTDVGGGFGMKLFMYPEYPATLYAARKFGRPVKWSSERTEAFISDDHGRDNVTTVELAVDKDARFLALRVEMIANMGAYLSNFGPFIPTMAGGAQMLNGLYTLQGVYERVRGVFTNTQPVDAYRGAGRPEAAFNVERIVDHASRVLGIDPVELRRRNFIPPSAMPYETITGVTYDSGEFTRNLEEAAQIADVAGFEQRRRDSAAKGKYRGLGIATYVEACAGGEDENADVRVGRDGKVTVYVGTQTNGQGHETAYKQIIAEHLGVEPDQITIVQGDTDLVRTGNGTGGSRSVPVGGAAIRDGSLKVQEKAKLRAADLMETAAVDIAFAEGRFTVVGTDRSMTLSEIAAKGDTEIAFEERGSFTPPSATFPNGAHIVELEIDGDTGMVEILRYTVVDDFGRVMNPLMVAGQVHGGIAQGLGQALLEHAVFDGDSGQLLSGSFMDYAMPRAVDLPFVTFKYNEIPCTTNPLGLKGAGEAGAIGAPPAIINAIVDALSPLGVEHVDMPATPQKLWQIIHSRQQRQAAE
ncbi:xanthine dehydrogenase family protein molybdopterin-binding subunit [Inquilinus limosus]|uniref:xanthine dehydrogenase family protein molybdopterin-binding subunit n=1 Tax=Inquilinus limosus TaxID=171674 RepID=UPI003F5CCDAF